MTVPSPAGGTPAGVPPVLVLVSDGCLACERVPTVLDEVRQRIPSARITVVDITAEGVPQGVPFVGTPTYIIEDRIVSVGNPESNDLVALIEGWCTDAG